LRYILLFVLLSILITILVAVLISLGILPMGFFFVIFLPFISTGGVFSKEKRPAIRERPPTFCPNCGFPLKGYENFCPRCGVRLR